jgi:hypothetical protein
MFGLSQTCSVLRNTTVGTNGRSQKTALYSSIECLALPMASQTAIEHDFSIGKAYDIFFAAGVDVRVGDQVVIGSATYDVRFVKAYAVPAVGHTLALCEQEI